MARIYYSISGIVSIILVIGLTVQARSVESGRQLWLATLSYSVFVASIHGILSHTRGWHKYSASIFYPTIMGVFFGLLLAGFIYLILPSFVSPYEGVFKWK